MAVKSSGGRGQLSSFERLPKECDALVTWAAQELASRDRTQTDIYAEFVSHCEALMKEHRGELEFAIPAFSSFNRYSLKQARLSRRLEQTREICTVLAKNHDAKASDDLTLIAGEMIKSVVLHMLGDAADGMAPKELKELADAFRSAQAAQNLSTKRTADVNKDLNARLGTAVEAVAKAKGLTAETTEAIKAEILGVTK